MNVNLRMEKLFKMRLINRRLIHAITNPVTMRDMANAILAVGGSPMMADCDIEMDEIAPIVDATIVNLGMLNEDKKRSINKVFALSSNSIVLDPVGIAVSSYRRSFAFQCLESQKVDVVKGNRAEILSLAGVESPALGVDSNDSSAHDIAIYESIALKFNVVIIVTDKVDIVTDGKVTAVVNNGSKMLRRITGAGCMLGGILGVMMNDHEDVFISSLLALLYFTIASEIAESKLCDANALGSFNVLLQDALAGLTFVDILHKAEYEIEKSSLKLCYNEGVRKVI